MLCVRVGTYHYGHAGRLNQGRYNNQNAENSPTILPKSLSTAEDDDVCYNAHSLENDGE